MGRNGWYWIGMAYLSVPVEVKTTLIGYRRRIRTWWLRDAKLIRSSADSPNTSTRSPVGSCDLEVYGCIIDIGAHRNSGSSCQAAGQTLHETGCQRSGEVPNYHREGSFGVSLIWSV